MRSLIVYESWFGNTWRIAEKIAEALGAGARWTCCRSTIRSLRWGAWI
jgi:flavodoxin